MSREPVKSSIISSFGYDSTSSSMEIEFRMGVILRYLKVPEKIYNEMKNAQSLGNFYFYHIKNMYEVSKVA
jgi:hypothetical protein